jgi:PRTRC genetic system protein E
MIDFTQLQEIIPKEGTLVLSFTKKDNIILVSFAPKIKGKDNSEEFAPLLLKGTVDELNADFAASVTDIAKKQELLAQLQATKTVTKAAAKKSGQLDKAIAKASSGTETKALPKATAAHTKPAKPEPPKGPQPLELFSPGIFGSPTENKEPAADAVDTTTDIDIVDVEVLEASTTTEQEGKDGTNS